jgi:hypothetical protein
MRASSEGDHLDSRIVDHCLGELYRTRDDIHEAPGQSGLLCDFGEEKRGERRLRCGPQDHAAPTGDRGAHLVADQVQREVEWGDREDRSDRKASRDSGVSLSDGDDVEGDEIAADPLRLLSGPADRVDARSTRTRRIGFPLT